MTDAILIPLPPSAMVGVYMLYSAGKVVYVGQSEDVVARVATHARERVKVFDSAAYYPTTLDGLDALEAKLIRELRPKFNSPMDRGGTGKNRGAMLALAEDVETAIGFLTHTDEDGISGGDLYARVTGRTNSGSSRPRFHQAMDVDPRVTYCTGDGVYRLSIAGAPESGGRP